MVGFKVKFYWYQIGSGDFLHAFFSTVAYNLENMKWGSRFPVIMKELYQGHLSKEHVDAAIGELAVISAELRDLSPDHVIWDGPQLRFCFHCTLHFSHPSVLAV